MVVKRQCAVHENQKYKQLNKCEQSKTNHNSVCK